MPSNAGGGTFTDLLVPKIIASPFCVNKKNALFFLDRSADGRGPKRYYSQWARNTAGIIVKNHLR